MSLQPSKQAVLQAYRSLLRTQKQVFDSKTSVLIIKHGLKNIFFLSFSS